MSPKPKHPLDLDPATLLGRRVVLGALAAALVLPVLGHAKAAKLKTRRKAKPAPTPEPDPGQEATAAPPATEPAASAGRPTPEQILARPEGFQPFYYAILVEGLWREGRRQQAAFWFYIFQSRTRAWAQADARGDNYAALRASLNDALGQTVNVWAASDLTAWQALAERSIAYEARLPLYPGRPDGLDEAAWLALVTASRAEYAQQMRAAFTSMTPEAFAEKRRAAGLPVGPLDSPGPALPDDWR